MNITVRSLAQDAEGFLWAGTEDGLYRFDGEWFQHFDLSKGLPGLNIKALLASPDGTLWIGTDQGLAFRREGRIQAVRDGIGTRPVEALACDAQGTVWANTLDEVYQGGRDRPFVRVPGMGHFGGGRPILAGRRGLWASSAQGLVQRMGDGTLRAWGRREGLPGSVFALVEDPRGRIWAHTGDRLWMLSPYGERFEPVPLRMPPPSALAGPTLYVDRRGRLWVVSRGQINVFEEGRWSAISEKQGGGPTWSHTLCEDTEGTLWIGGLGLHQMVGQEAWTYYDRQDGLPSDTVWSIRRDRQGTLWAGTMAGIARATPSGWKVLRGTEGRAATGIAELPDGRLLASGSPTALYEWTPGATAAVRHALPLPTNSICVGLVVDRRGRTWLCTRFHGVFTAERRGSGWKLADAGLPRDEYDSVALDSEGGVWISGNQALYHCDGGAWQRYTPREGLLAHVFRVRALANGEVIVGYRNDLGWARLRHGPRGLEILEQHPGKERTNQDNLYLAGLDARGRLWLGGARGLECIGGGTSRTFRMGDGLVHNDLNDNAFYADADGSIWVGTSGGLAHYSPSPREVPPRAPVVRIRDAWIGDKSLDLYAPGEPATSWKRNSFDVYFSGISFRSPNQVEYQTRLAGLEDAWRTPPIRSQYYAGLRPGRYRFEVRARLNGGPWGAPAALAFQVRSPWWMTWPAIGGGIMAFCLGVWGFVRLRTLRLDRRNRTLQAQIAEATLEIRHHERQLEDQAKALTDLNEQKNHFFGLVAHDLRTPLARIAMAAELMEDEDDLEEVSRTANTIRFESLEMSALVGRFLDIAAIEDDRVKPEPTDLPLPELIEDVISRHAPRAEEKALTLRTEMPEDGTWIHADRRFTQEVLDNLVGNAIKFSPLGSTVILRLERGDDRVVISVEDEGPGLTPEDLKRVFGRYATLSARPTGGEKSTGLGLSIVKHMVMAQGGRVWVESEPGKGAAFRVALPSGKPPDEART